MSATLAHHCIRLWRLLPMMWTFRTDIQTDRLDRQTDLGKEGRGVGREQLLRFYTIAEEHVWGRGGRGALVCEAKSSFLPI